VRSEIGLLFSTRDMKQKEFQSDEYDWNVNNCVMKLEDYRLLRKLGRWLPSLLAAHELFAPLCTLELDSDPFRIKMNEAATFINDKLNEEVVVEVVPLSSDTDADGSGGGSGGGGGGGGGSGGGGTAAAVNVPVVTRQLKEKQTLGSIPNLVAGIREVFSEYSEDELDFLSCLGENPSLSTWFLEHKDQQEFNQMLNVVRPCTDEPRLLSAIASLVHIRMLLLDPLYSLPPYPDLTHLMKSFCKQLQSENMKTTTATLSSSSGGAVSGSPLWHLQNITSSFDALSEVFEKQTKSPSIKSLYDLHDIMLKGTFVLLIKNTTTTVSDGLLDNNNNNNNNVVDTSSNTSREFIQLRVEMKEMNVNYDMEYLLDLRSKLLMAEIPDEIEQELGSKQAVDTFVNQLNVMGEMLDTLRWR
jgi:hypothetical protein